MFTGWRKPRHQRDRCTDCIASIAAQSAGGNPKPIYSTTTLLAWLNASGERRDHAGRGI